MFISNTERSRALAAWLTFYNARRQHAALGGQSPMGELCGRLAADVLDQPPCDDAALLAVRTHTVSADRVARWDLPADPAAVRLSRELAKRQLAEWGLEELSFTTELIVSEPVTNAVRYGKGSGLPAIDSPRCGVITLMEGAVAAGTVLLTGSSVRSASHWARSSCW